MKNIYLITTTLIFLMITSCQDDKDCIRGSGAYISKEYNISDINSISIASMADVVIEKGETSLRIEAQSNILQALNVTSNGGHLEIGKNNCFKNFKSLKVYLSTPQLEAISTSGKMMVKSDDVFTAERFTISGSGELNMDVKVETATLQTILSGESNITISGAAMKHDIDISGLGTIHGFNLLTKETKVTLSGAALVETTVESKLDVKISGQAEVHYKGTPSIIQNISGNGKLIDKN